MSTRLNGESIRVSNRAVKKLYIAVEVDLNLIRNVGRNFVVKK